MQTLFRKHSSWPEVSGERPLRQTCSFEIQGADGKTIEVPGGEYYFALAGGAQ